MPNNNQIQPQKRYRYPFAHERSLRQAILAGRRADSFKALERLYGSLLDHSPSVERLQSDAIHLAVVLLRKCYQSGLAVDQMLGSALPYYARLIQADDRKEVYSVLEDLMDHLLNVIGEDHDHSPRHTVQRAIQYIQSHYHRGLTLEDVAYFAGLSYSYFSRIFSRETGITFHDYLTKTRLEAAKHLLLTTDFTVEKIARSVGYDDPSHFIRTFKRYSGTTPRHFSVTYATQEAELQILHISGQADS